MALCLAFLRVIGVFNDALIVEANMHATLIRGKGDVMRTRVRIIWLPDLPG